MPDRCWQCGRMGHSPSIHKTEDDKFQVIRESEEDALKIQARRGYHLKGSQEKWGKPNPDRHKDGSRVVSIRLPSVVYHQLQELIGNSTRTHETVSSYIGWLIETQALRKR